MKVEGKFALSFLSYLGAINFTFSHANIGSNKGILEKYTVIIALF